MSIVTVTGKLDSWAEPGRMEGTFLKIEGKDAEAITAHELHSRILNGKRRGFGSVKVEAILGESEWITSVFPQDYGWFLPVKAAVRRAEGVAEGDRVEVELTLL